VAVVADSAQFSAMVTELAGQAYVGTALTVQLAVGLSLTVVTIWLVPLLQDLVTWRWAFAVLAPGPALGSRPCCGCGPARVGPHRARPRLSGRSRIDRLVSP
jgi:hypothetical protein